MTLYVVMYFVVSRFWRGNKLVMQAFYAFCENELEPYSYQIHRMQMIFKKKGE